MGRAAAELFAEKGAKVVIGGRRKAQGEQIAESIRQGGGQSIFIQTDVAEADQVENLVQQTIATFRKIDILFNNAGIHNPGHHDPHDEDLNIYDHVLNVNLKGAFLCTKYVVPPMTENNGGSIINNSSVLDSRATDSSSTSYHVSKGGLAMLTKKSALSYAKFNIRVNSIQPGAIATEMSGIPWNDLENSTVIGSRRELQPLHRMGHPYDVAYAALFFASDESAFVTGATLLVDGGASARF